MDYLNTWLDANIKDRKLFRKRTIICFLGVFGMGFFLSFLIMVGLGTDPATFMNLSVAKRIGWTLGNWQLTANIIMLILEIVFDRKIIGLGTIFNMVLIGYYADFFCWLWRKIPDQEALFTRGASRWIIFFIALLCFIVSAAIYMNAQSGLSPYDGLAKILANALPKIPFFLTRICYDFAAIGIGVLAGGKPTIGIILMAVGLGPVITLVGKKMEKILG